MRAIDDILRALVHLFNELHAFLKFAIAALAGKLLEDYFPYVLAFVVGAIIIWLWQKQSSASTNNKVPPPQQPRTLFLVATVAAIGIGAFILYQPEQQKNPANGDTPTPRTTPQNNFQPTPQRPTPMTMPQPDYSDNSFGRCFISNYGSDVNVRSRCDYYDCTSDPSTIYTSLPDGTEINVLTNEQSISSGKGYDWLPIKYGGYVVYVASSKVYCE